MNNYEHESRELLLTLRDLPEPSEEVIARVFSRTIVENVPLQSAPATASKIQTATIGKITAALILAIGVAGYLYYRGQVASDQRQGPSTSPSNMAGSIVVAEKLNEDLPAREVAIPEPTLREEVSPDPKETGSPHELRTSTEPPTKQGNKVTRRNAAFRDKREPTLSVERRLLNNARSALRDSAFPAANRSLRTHILRFPNGLLREEREVLWISLLIQQGKHGDAKRRAIRFKKTFPSSLHHTRMQLDLERAEKNGNSQ